MISIIINGIEIKVKKNLTILQACNLLNIQIPRFCFQENLKIAGNCRMCLVELKNSPKPVAACAMPVMPNMEIFTNTPLVQKARESVLELILINHPLDCPICDQASECDLQDQTLSFGSERSRFFFKKRGVEDKNVGPFIKTIMTRCIHCTRCVRFANDFCNGDNFGTTGRGSNTEINFYNKNIFYSEFSGNLIDLCPVGALTSKPYSFKTRAWELKKKEGIDILDAIGSNINIDIFKNEILRILPKTNNNINKEWITNKTRFFFDSLKYQRIEHPLIKNIENNQFKKISWQEAFNIINLELLKRDSSKIQGIIGNLTDCESIYLLKKNFNKLGISNISYLYPNKKNNKINNDIPNYLFNNGLKNIEKSDLCLIINSDIRTEGSILNIHLMNRYKKGNFIIATIGPKLNYTYNIQHLGLSYKILIDIIQGKHSFCKLLKKAKNPLIILGSNMIYYKKGSFIFEKFQKLSFLKIKNFNILHTQTSYLNLLEINFKKLIFNKMNTNLYYLYNTNFSLDLKKKINKKDNFIIYQGHHFTLDAQQSNLILPGLSFLEKEGFYINVEGLIQKNYSILKKQSNQKSDINIFKNLLIYIQLKNKTNIINKISFLNFFEIYPYFLKKKIQFIDFYNYQNKKLTKINIYNMSFLNRNIYINTILENYSRILMNSQNILKNKSNFKL